MIKKKMAKGGAILLSAALLATTILPNFPKLGTKMEAEAFQGKTGVCVDKTGYSNNHFYHGADQYDDTMIDLNGLTYGTAEYEAALAQNVATLRATFGSDENIMKIFWVGIATWLTGGVAQYGDIYEVKSWYDRAREQAYDSALKGYFDDSLVNGNYNFPAVSEADLGMLLHDGGATWNRLVAQAPLLQYLVYNLFDGENWETKPQVMPQLSKVFLDSYKDWQTGETGAALWPEDATEHMIQLPHGVIPDKKMVQEAALDMEKNENYWASSGKGPTASSSKDKKKYQIEVKAGFASNARLQVWNDDPGAWQQVYYPFLLDGGPVTINGWEIGFEILTSSGGEWETGRYTFEWKGEGDPQSLAMYFNIDSGTAPSIGTKTFNSPVEFAATYMKVNKCVACGASPKQALTVHQTHIAYRQDPTLNSCPCFRLGEDDPLTPQGGEPAMHFCIFSHSEDFEANYNVQMDKYDYETGKTLQGALFELYERFDDSDQINTESDGPETLFEGPKEEHGSGYLTDPVIWDDFRLVTSMTTDENGHISYNIKKEYHYEKTFCDGHPKPDVSGVEGELAEEAMAKWQAMVDACEAKAEEMPGIHFHWLLDESGEGGGDEESEFALDEDDDGGDSEDGEGGDDTGCPGIEVSFEKSGAKADRDATYEKFINLKYSYTWKEYQAKDGYIRHDTHVDDVPIEVITTNSSEAGAESEFADEYSKDITINESVGSEYADSDSEEDGDEGEDEGEEEGFSLSWQSLLSPFTLEAHASEIHTPDDMEESDFFEDEEYDLASPSNADWRISLTNHGTAYLSDPGAYAMALENEGDDGGEGAAADFEQIYEAAFVGEQVGGEDVEPGPSDNYSHCNDEDGEGNSWRIYDHRTEGEIHFNKRDMNLLDQDAGEFDAYGIANADGALEGAVYGLFAAENIVHPDGKTEVIYWKDDLVAVATTDRNGDGSFMVYTEAPGHTYDYESGSIVENEHASSAKENLFGDNPETEWHVDDYTADGEYKGGPTQRLYENNNDNNGNYWIGRPLILGNYYIKELSRSEGYELSVNGKLDAITNRGEDLETKTEDGKGTASVSTNLYIQGQETVGMPNEPFFETTSEGMVENGGYDIVIDKLPEGVEFYRHDRSIGNSTYQVIDHYEYQEKKDEDGNTVYQKAEVPGIPKFDENGDMISKEEDAVYVMNNVTLITFGLNMVLLREEILLR